MAVILQRISDKLVGEISEKEKLEITLPTVLGRGSILKCPEKKISRNHATLDWDDEGCLITSTHSSPTFLLVDGEERLLSTGQTAVLKNGDKFGLQKEFYWYKVIIESPVTNEIQSNIEESKNELNVKENEHKSNFENNLKDSNDHIAEIHPTNSNIAENTTIQSIPSTSTNEYDKQKDLKSLPILQETNKEHITETIVKGIGENSNKEKTEEKTEINKEHIIETILEGIGVNNDKEKEIKTENDSINFSSEVKPNLVIHTEEKKPVETLIKDSIILPTTTEVEPSEQRERKLPAWMSNKENVSIDKDKIKTNNTSSLQDQQGRGLKRPKTATNSPRKKRASPSKPPTKPNQYHAVSQDFVDSERDLHNLSEDDESIKPTNGQTESQTNSGQTLPSTAKQPAGNNQDTPRCSCSFGSQCYRKNSSHQEELSHPGDSDYVAPADDADDDLPECEFGVDCYRKNPDHKRQFKHTRKPQPQRRAKRKAKRRDSDSASDDYDLDDPFLYDGSSDDYAPTDEDSSNEDESQDYKLSQEEKDTLRMIKEAKKFIKKS